MLPCGKENCSGCTKCIYDAPLDTPLTKLKDMRNYGLMPVGDNPSTTQLIIPGAATRHHLLPIDDNMGPTQLQLPFNENKEDIKDKLYCNTCPFFLRVQRPNKTTFNTRCTADTTRPGGSERVVKLNVYPDEKVKKPFWCPSVRDSIINPKGDSVKVGPKTIYLDNVKKPSMLSEEQQKKWNDSKHRKELRDKWLNAPGLMSWDDLKVNCVYHLPPMFEKQRMDVKIESKFMTSLKAVNLRNRQIVWFYKSDEEYKYMSLIG